MERKMTIEEEGVYQEDYQMRMLQDNKIDGFLDVKGRGMDGRSCYAYDVSGKVSMKALYEKNEINSKDIRAFLIRLLSVIKEAEKYLLDVHRILLDPQYIYYEEGEYFFCYYPHGTGSLWEGFHTLTEYLVKRADYKEQDCVQMIFLLHKESMKENYSLEKLVSQCIRTGNENEEPEGSRVEYDPQECQHKEYSKGDERGKYIEDYAGREYGRQSYDRAEHDWITEQEMGSFIMEETENMWTPVKRFLNRHKKSKWGDWDGLYIEEEEL